MSMDQPPTSPGLSPGMPGRDRSRGFSFHSDKSGGSKPKVDLSESPADKARRDSIWKSGHKSNPNSAITEETPGARNLNELTTLVSLRDEQHKDANGNVIVDPDLSNPTRPRLERPLDTIRSFEKAIDNGYKRRSSYMISESYNQDAQGSRRSSSYMNGMDSPGRHSAMGGGYYGGQREQGQPPRMRYSNRMMSDGGMYNQGRPYPQHGYHQSQDTMNTGMTNNSDSTGPWASGTDPSSENSSIDRNVVGGNGKQPAEGHGYGNNYSSPPIMEEQGANGYGGPVRPPPEARRPIALGNTTAAPGPGGSLPVSTRPEPEKKKSWLKRRFSKKE